MSPSQSDIEVQAPSWRERMREYAARLRAAIQAGDLSQIERLLQEFDQQFNSV